MMIFLAALALLGTLARAATILFNTDPFAGSAALTIPGRQIVGNETFLSFSIASDVFAFDSGVFGIPGSFTFANDVVGNLPAFADAIVLRTFDNDGDPGTAFGAGTAANLIAAQLTAPAPGFFVYFNSGLDLARLVYSTDLNQSDSDLKILARLTNLAGEPGRDEMATFTAANFAVIPAPVPEPASVALLALAVGTVAGWRLRQRRSSKQV